MGALGAPGRPGLSPRPVAAQSRGHGHAWGCGGPPGVWVSASPPGRPPRPVPAPRAFAPGHLPVLQASVTRHFPAGPCSASTAPQTQGVGRAAEAGARPGTLLALHKRSPVLSTCGVPPHSGNCSWPVLHTGELSPPPPPRPHRHRGGAGTGLAPAAKEHQCQDHEGREANPRNFYPIVPGPSCPPGRPPLLPGGRLCCRGPCGRWVGVPGSQDSIAPRVSAAKKA